MGYNTPGFPVHHQLPELAQIHVLLLFFHLTDKYLWRLALVSETVMILIAWSSLSNEGIDVKHK